ncbi:protein AE7-like [Neltuma alba]|uniref:protein AE7-like n=1 Tax=Neltuma alba TaxID=207710 RepID=UPI0010A315FB|nr:protein AE7-like [Prosopis alba]XP_028805953.1 protein AE7-like [Prosopis alba]XP_028805965.1 protein AE7-like [Prosopis alba]
MVSGLINANPIIYEKIKREGRARTTPTFADDDVPEPIDQQGVFDHIRDIRDPEYPNSLEELRVITEDAIELDDQHSYVGYRTFTPTLEYCAVPSPIGLRLRVKLMRSLPSRCKISEK